MPNEKSHILSLYMQPKFGGILSWNINHAEAKYYNSVHLKLNCPAFLPVTRLPPKLEIRVLKRDTQQICAESGLEKCLMPTELERQ